MSPEQMDEPPNSLEQRLGHVERGIRLFAVTLLILSSGPNIALAFSIRSYTANLASLLGMFEQSAVMRFVLNHPLYLIALALFWPIAGAFITLRARDPYRAMIASCIYLVLVTLQFAVTWIAFVSPWNALFKTLQPI